MSEIIKKLAGDDKGIDGKKITDGLGRVIVLRKSDILDRFHLLKAMGSDSSNMAMVVMMLTTLHVAAIDESPFPTPKTSFECEAALKRLAEEGWEAVNQEVNAWYEKREEANKNTIKK